MSLIRRDEKHSFYDFMNILWPKIDTDMNIECVAYNVLKSAKFSKFDFIIDVIMIFIYNKLFLVFCKVPIVKCVKNVNTLSLIKGLTITNLGKVLNLISVLMYVCTMLLLELIEFNWYLRLNINKRICNLNIISLSTSK